MLPGWQELMLLYGPIQRLEDQLVFLEPQDAPTTAVSKVL